jgi:DNA helicase HerA-like ATPase
MKESSGIAATAHEINLQVARWRIRVAGVKTAAEYDEIESELCMAPMAIQESVRPLLVTKLKELKESMPANITGAERHAIGSASSFDWVTGTLDLVLKAASSVEAGESGAFGLIPLGCMRDGGEVLHNHRVVIHDQFKGNRAAMYAQSGKGKTNLVKIVLFWMAFNSTYGKLVFDYKGEYIPWTKNERGEDVPGLCEHPLAKEKIVLYTTKERHIRSEQLNKKLTVKRLKVNLQSILPRDFALYWPNLTKAQQELLYTYDDDPSIYEIILGEEKNWHKLSAWFGGMALSAEEEGSLPEVVGETAPLEASAKRVVRNIRKKLLAAQKRSYVTNYSASIDVDPAGKLLLHTPYNEAFLEDLKAHVPHKHRQWEPKSKAWVIDGAYRESCEKLISQFFGAVEESDSLGLISQDLAAGKLVVVDFSGLPSESDRDLIATLVTRRQFEYNLERIDMDEGGEGRVPFVAFFEEAQNILGADKMRDHRNSIFIRTFKEGRALSIGTISITQQPGALSKDLTSQISYYIVQHLRSRDDIRDLISMDPALEGTESDISRRVPGNALYVDNDRSFPLPVKIDKFDSHFVEAVRHAYDAYSNAASDPWDF